MNVRVYHPNDCQEIIELFYNTVHAINATDYAEIQLNAWAPDIDTIKQEINLNNRFMRDYTVVVEKDGIIVGFGNRDGKGYFDCLYVHKDHQRMGIATLIANEIEQDTSRKGIPMITTDASITAKPFFEKRGYLVKKKQNVEIRGQVLANYKMEKTFR